MRNILYPVFIAILIFTACKKEDKITPTETPKASGTSGKTPTSRIAEIAYLTGKRESDIPKDLDGVIIYGTSTSLRNEELDFTVCVDYFSAGFYNPYAAFQNVGTLSINDTLVPFVEKDSVYHKEGQPYFPEFPQVMGGLAFNKNTNINMFGTVETLPALPINVESNRIVILTPLERNKEITIKLEGNIVQGDTIIFFLSDSTNRNYKRFIFPVSQTSYTFTVAQINELIPADQKKFYIGILVDRCRIKKLANGKKVMMIGTYGILQTLKFDK